MVKKGLLAGLLLLALAVLQPAPESPAVAAASVQGDVNCGGTVTAVDALQVLRSVAGLTTTAGCLAEAGDTNCDANVNAVDALRILRHVAGLTNSVPAGCAAIGDSLAPTPTSEELIAAAVAAGTITYEQSLLYRALALYDLPGLPEEFRSPVIDYHAGRLLFVEIEDNKAQLSQATLDALAPIVGRPNDSISIFNNPPAQVGAAALQTAGVWTSTTNATGEVRVWIRTDWNSDADLSRYAQAATRVWSKLDQVFGLPIPDEVENPPTGINPDSAIDIYFLTTTGVDPRMPVCLSHPNTQDCRLGTDNGSTGPSEPRSGNSSSGYVMIQNTFTGDDLLRVIAHELAHTVQNKYDRHEDFWLSDSTADWVAFRVLQLLAPTDKTKLYERANEAVFANSDLSMSRDVGKSRYGAWLYYFFASMNGGGDTVVKNVWQNAAASGVQGIQAADQAIPFATNFDDFTVRNWNEKPPLVTAYKDADPIFPSYKPKTQPWFFALDEERKESDPIEALAARYYRYTFNGPIRKITVDNLVAGNPDLHVWALVKIGADWKVPEDWSSQSQKTFCRTLPLQNVTDLVIIVSNSNLTNPIPGTDKLKVKTETSGCVGWVGTATGTSTYDNILSLQGAALQAGHQVLTATTTANIMWEEDPLFLYGCNCTAFFPVGTIDWSVSYSYESECCTCSDTDTGQLQAGTGLPHVTYQMMIRWDDPNDPDQYIYSGGGDVPAEATINCDGGFTYSAMDFFAVPANIDLPSPTPTPTLTPTPTPTPTPVPSPTAPPVAAPIAAGGQAAAATGMCDTMQFTFPRDATTFSGSCYQSYESQWVNELFTWSFTRVDVIQPSPGP